MVLFAMNPVGLSLLTLLALGLAGCIPYPVLKQIQPQSVINVLDEQGSPIVGAEVFLTTRYNPHGQSTKQAKSTNLEGRAEFEGRTEWQSESIFVMHGVRFYDWFWCVRKPGYKTYITNQGTGDGFEPVITVRLSRGASTDCR